jgi:D-allose transport system substrate-binding protein
MNRRNIHLFVSIFLVILVTVSSCMPGVAEPSPVPKTDTQEGSCINPSDIKIGVIVKTLSNTSWQSTAEGAYQAGKELGVIVEVKDVPTEQDFQKQLELGLNMVNQDYDAIAASSMTNTNMIPAIVEANKRGIPWISMAEENDPTVMAEQDAFETAFIKIYFYKEGLKIGEYVAEALGGTGKVGIVEGQAGNSATIARITGIKDALQNYPDIEIVASQPGDWDRQKALTVAANMIQANPDIKAIMANNDTMAMGVLQAVIQAEKLGEIIVTGDDGTIEALEAIQAGSMGATVNLGAWMLGYISVYAGTKAVVEKQNKLPEYELEPLLITKENVAQVLEIYPLPIQEFLELNSEHPYQPIQGFCEQ